MDKIYEKLQRGENEEESDELSDETNSSQYYYSQYEEESSYSSETGEVGGLEEPKDNASSEKNKQKDEEESEKTTTAVKNSLRKANKRPFSTSQKAGKLPRQKRNGSITKKSLETLLSDIMSYENVKLRTKRHKEKVTNILNDMTKYEVADDGTYMDVDYLQYIELKHTKANMKHSNEPQINVDNLTRSANDDKKNTEANQGNLTEIPEDLATIIKIRDLNRKAKEQAPLTEIGSYVHPRAGLVNRYIFRACASGPAIQPYIDRMKSTNTNNNKGDREETNADELKSVIREFREKGSEVKDIGTKLEKKISPLEESKKYWKSYMSSVLDENQADSLTEYATSKHSFFNKQQFLDKARKREYNNYVRNKYQ